MEEYLAERKKVVGGQMRTYMDNYFKFDSKYSTMNDEQRNAFVARYNVRDGGRIGFANGSFPMEGYGIGTYNIDKTLVQTGYGPSGSAQYNYPEEAAAMGIFPVRKEDDFSLTGDGLLNQAAIARSQQAKIIDNAEDMLNESMAPTTQTPTTQTQSNQPRMYKGRDYSTDSEGNYTNQNTIDYLNNRSFEQYLIDMNIRPSKDVPGRMAVYNEGEETILGKDHYQLDPNFYYGMEKIPNITSAQSTPDTTMEDIYAEQTSPELISLIKAKQAGGMNQEEITQDLLQEFNKTPNFKEQLGLQTSGTQLEDQISNLAAFQYDQ